MADKGKVLMEIEAGMEEEKRHLEEAEAALLASGFSEEQWVLIKQCIWSMVKLSHSIRSSVVLSTPSAAVDG